MDNLVIKPAGVPQAVADNLREKAAWFKFLKESNIAVVAFASTEPHDCRLTVPTGTAAAKAMRSPRRPSPRAACKSLAIWVRSSLWLNRLFRCIGSWGWRGKRGRKQRRKERGRKGRMRIEIKNYERWRKEGEDPKKWRQEGDKEKKKERKEK